ncbi:hypothetical protein TNIN_76342 [Trichonephila inaurata madagascariensis]|uniref:Uncharacterized protein n=1 Tax=Trichonephila inaurata madagascariensis TaxID=2747483 RepID=A0A8X6MAA6_9ARAC|nr:hypothetical protein TNIN_76342 [Trichonephila inaurata madagascariensis]
MPSAGDFFQLKRRSLAGRIRRFLSAHRKSLPNYFRSIFDPKPIHTPSGGRAERKGVPRRCLLCVPFHTQESFGYVLGLLLFETRKGLSFGGIILIISSFLIKKRSMCISSCID